MAANVFVLCVARTSAAMTLTMHGEQVHAFHQQGFEVISVSQYANKSLFLHSKNQKNKGLLIAA